MSEAIAHILYWKLVRWSRVQILAKIFSHEISVEVNLFDHLAMEFVCKISVSYLIY